jgi:hypothetical protein
MDVSNRAFSQLYNEYKPGLLGHGSDKHLRADTQGTQLYTHSAFMISGSGEAAAKGRQEKWAAGAEYIKNTIDQEFGDGMGDKIKKISAEGGPNLNKEVHRGDLELIRATIKDVIASRAHLPPELTKPHGKGEATIGKETRIEWSKGPDAEAFRHENLHARDNWIRGESFVKLSANGFHEFGAPEKLLAEQPQSSSKAARAMREVFPYAESPDKVHLSISQDQLGRAWDLLLPKLTSPDSPVKGFKVTDLEVTLDRMRQNQPGTDRHESAKRVTEGAQITLYSFESLDDETREEHIQPFADFVKQLTSILRENGIGSGKRPDSDLNVDEYASYRQDKTDEPDPGVRRLIRPEEMSSADYAALKETMKNRPMFKALTAS